MPDRLQIDYTQMQEHIALLMGWNRDPTTWSDRKSTDADRCIESGARKFYKAHAWSFLNVRGKVTSPAPYSTGTVTIVADTDGSEVTLSGGTWPAWAADGELTIAGTRYSVLARTSDTVIVLEDTELTAAAGTEYSLGQFRFPLPVDFAGLNGPITYDTSSTNMRCPLRSTHESEIRRLYMASAENMTGEYPKLYAIYARAHDLTEQQRYILELFPPGTAQIDLQFMYRSWPGKPSIYSPFPAGTEEHSETLLEAILSEAETKLHAVSREHTARYEVCLARSIKMDGMISTPELMAEFTNPTSDAYYSDQVAASGPITLDGLTTYQGYEDYF